MAHAHGVLLFGASGFLQSLNPKANGVRSKLREHHFRSAKVAFEVAKGGLIVTSIALLAVVDEAADVLTCVVAEAYVLVFSS